jgi:hypothetical protein
VAPSSKEAPVKTAANKSIVKVIPPKAKSGSTGMSEIELILVKPIGYLKNSATQMCQALPRDGVTKATTRFQQLVSGRLHDNF